ncbi:MAG TPA: SEC-C metal-binding domain-containing protein, partial [Candidatus Paceibacterota bacterium]|nr:SEC-C metal-binding domain-containing protein [Candidatus Paceibacterota bacterium]
RIDNQLRGRAGRQGDPGATQFYVSLEDTLMRVFASDNIKNLMGKFGIPEDEAIENGLVSRALESAQTKIEGFNFDARKHVLEFDNVLDKQRRAVYARRRAIMTGSGEDVERVLGELAGGNEEALKVIAEKSEALGREHFLGHARTIVLQTMDLLWVEHLESMEYLRGSVNLRAYGQRDPLVEYRKEGARLYRELEAALTSQVFELLEALQPHEAENSPTNPTPIIKINAPAAGATLNELGRNDLCPCGSGKKWKNCGLKNTEEHQRLMAAKK